MGSRTALNLGLLGLILGLGALALWAPAEPPPAPPAQVLALDPDRPTRIRLERSDAPAIELVRRAGHWEMQQPFAVAANPARVDTVLRLLELTSRMQYPLAGLDLDEYGLREPALSVELDQTRLEFGDTTPLDGQRYVRTGETLHVVPDTLYYHLQAPAAAYVSPRLLPPAAELEAVRLPGLQLSMASGEWRTAPLRASIETAAEWAARWRSAQALRVRPYRGESLGEPVEVVLQGEEATLRFVPLREEAGLLRPDLGLVYELPAQGLAPLLHPAAERDDA